MRNTAQKILADFDAAAPDYDRWAEIQAQTAQQLVAKCDATSPVDILDIGCGTGFVSESAAKKWPDATITALDHAPAMLLEAQRKVPRLKTILADAASAEITQKFDIIFSSMMLHWLPDPLAALKLWRTWLKPNGVMHIAFLTENSFSEWADLCRDDGVENGLWKMPPASLADATGATCEYQNIQISH
ncbi:MAG TPA: methyltransferase domain-containing protein, partial [Alphaproteobacteria bacterium]|nr:methyltransferase domain-containing protein [Alphaproteobacteria bacterium]